MEKKKDMLEQHLAENFIELAKEEEQQINHIKNHGSEDDIRMPEGTKEAIRAKLDDEIEKIKEAEREEIYSRLSEEDRYALERGRKIIQEEKERAKANGAEEMPAEESAKKHTRKRHGRKPWKIYIAVASSARNDGSCWHHCGWRTRTDGHDGQTGSWGQRSRESQLQ